MNLDLREPTTSLKEVDSSAEHFSFKSGGIHTIFFSAAIDIPISCLKFRRDACIGLWWDSERGAGGICFATFTSFLAHTHLAGRGSTMVGAHRILIEVISLVHHASFPEERV
jgi:hypothetical protein